jgi:uncharacterized protein YfaS (alpha-2-macroglobulin family)
MKKSLVFIALVTVVFTAFLVAQKIDFSFEKRWKTVQEFANKQLPESALKEVEAILVQAQQEKDSPQVIKAMVCKMRFILEKNPDEAPVLIKDFEAYTEKSTDPAERALLHSMTAELYAQYYQKDQWKINQRPEIKGIVPEDINEWTKNIYFDKITKHLAVSIENRAVLQQTNAQKFKELFNVGSDSPTMQPTLFDFLSYRTIELLQKISQTTTIKNLLNKVQLFDLSEFSTLKLDTAFQNSIENHVVKTYQQLLDFRLKEKGAWAIVYADLHYLRYLKQQTNLPNADSLYIVTLNKLKDQYSDNEVVVEVMGELANYYLTHSDNNIHNKKIAAKICNEGISRFPNYCRIGMLKNMQQKIERKSLSIHFKQVAKPATKLKVQIESTNISKLQLTVYKVDATALEYLNYNQNRHVEKLLYPKRTLVKTKKIYVRRNRYFRNVTTDVDFKTGDYGIYEICVEEYSNKKVSDRAIKAFTVSDLAFMRRTNESNRTSVYVLDRMTGMPVNDVTVSVYDPKWTENAYSTNLMNISTTDKDGMCQYPFKEKNASKHVLIFEKVKDCYFTSDSYSYFNEYRNYENKDVRLNIFTDRSLYRPRQKVYFKGIAYISSKSTQEAIAGEEYEATLFDANGQKVSSKKYTTNEYGSIAGEFVLPEGGLNGTYRIKIGNNSQTIWVEEYKRPTFEVIIDKPIAELSFGEMVTLKGAVKAFSGYTIADAMIKYRVVRSSHRYCWWFRESNKQVINGTTTSKNDGTFEVSFTPEKSKDEDFSFRKEQFYTYTVYANVTDPKGETQKAQQYCSVGDKSLFIVTQIAEKVDKKLPFNIEVTTETLNGKQVNSIVKYSLYRLEGSDVYNEKQKDKTKFRESKKMLSGSYETNNKKINLKVDNLASGRYKMVFTTPDAHGKEVKLEKTFILYDNNDSRPPVKSYVWLLTPKTECFVGENAQIIFGTSTKNTSVLYEVMHGNELLESRWISYSDEIKRFDIPFKESYGSGVTVVFTFMKDEQLFTKQVRITRKVEDKKLTPTLSVFRNKLLPGEKAEWTITVPEGAKNKKSAEVMVGMYDASLDALRLHNWYFIPSYKEPFLYSPIWTSNGFNSTSDNVYYGNETAKIIEFNFNQLNWFGLNLQYSYSFNRALAGRISGVSVTNVNSDNAHYIIRGTSTTNEEMMLAQEKNSVLDEVVVVGYGTQKKRDITGSIATISDALQGKILVDNNGKSEMQAQIHIRTNFIETAFFYPQLRTDADGNVKFTFISPESLTRWNVKMLAHTKDLYFGYSEAQVITQKDLMVQMNLPRFVRQSDKLVLSASVINLTDKELKASVQFEMIDPATERPIVLKDATPKTVTLAANETKAVEWELTEFSQFELVTCKVVTQAGNFSDGEQKYLPVLPDKVLITESMPLTIRGKQSRTFNFENLLKNGSTVDTKNLSVEFSSNPAWYAVQALPTISGPENENALDYFTAYYANSLAAFIANSNPKIAATFDQWKKAGGSREALLSNLEKNKELKNMLLEETPWVMAAKNETEQKRQIALLFDLNMQKNQTQQYLDKLISLQLSSGGFSWFNGMRESRYITQEILLNLARLAKMTKSDLLTAYRLPLTAALHYLDLEIVHDYDNLKKNNKNYNSEMSFDNIQLFYLHLRSEYPTIPIEKSAQEAVQFYTSQSEKYWPNFTLYGKAMMAMVANRNGKIQLANEILKSLKENALKTDELGMYWAKNTSGYFWNERPIAVQAAIIEAFAEISKNPCDVEEMKIWLLKQKQTQRWDSPMETVNAIYALLNQGSDLLANDGSVQLKVGNTTLQPASTEAGTGYFKETIPNSDINSETGKVTVSKSNKGIGWGAMYWQYYQDLDKVSNQGGSLKITKKLFVEKMTSTGKTMLPIEQTPLNKGDKIITRLVITTDRNLEFVALKDLRASCFEPVNQLSGCQWKEGVCYYQTTKDASTQFFISYLPKGTYVFEYELWANNSGEFTSGIATIQCQYAPEFVSHTGGDRIRINQ